MTNVSPSQPILTAKIGQRLRLSRQSAGLSLAELSAKTQGHDGALSKSRISNYEQGLRRPSIEVAQRLGSALGIDPKWLLCLEDRP